MTKGVPKRLAAIHRRKAGTTMTRIKICGIRRIQDVQAVNYLQPEYAGFVFAPSKRQVSIQTAEDLSRRLHPSICPVGVYVNAEKKEIMEAAGAGVIRAVQLHGTESRQQVRELKACLPEGTLIIKAVRMEDAHALQEWMDSEADYLLLDAKNAGGGETFDHELITAAGTIGKPWFLAGGMNADNALPAIRRFAPYGIDVSSGVETAGYKDIRKMETLIRRVRYE